MPTRTVAADVYGTPGSIEYQAACSLRDLIGRSFNSEEGGFISIHTDLYFPGQQCEQIDLLLHAYFPKGLSKELWLDGADQQIVFQDIVAVIEVKAHRRENVLFSGANAEVLYDGAWKSASSQSHAQVYSVKPFLKRELGWSPWICNLIFFTNLNEADLPTGQRNYLTADSSLTDLFQRLCLSRKLNTLRTPVGAATFSCVPASDEGQRSARNEQLKRLLRTERDQTITPPAPSEHLYGPRSYWSTRHLLRLFFSHTWTEHRRPGVSLFKVLTVLLVLGWIATVATHKVVRTVASTTFASATQPPVLRTCVAVTPSCYCQTSTRFRKGKTVEVQFVGKQQRPMSAIVRKPDGKEISLNFRDLNLPPKYFEGRCFIARHTLEKDAPIGSYSVQTTTINTAGQSTGALSLGFQVTR